VSHVAPSRWADLARGRLSDGERRRALAHAERCADCARARDRIAGAAAAMTDIARAPAPELGWDHIRARIHWTVSSERRSQERRAARPRRWWLAGPAVLAAAAIAGVVVGADRLIPTAHPLPAVAVTIQSVPATAEPAPAPDPAPLTGVVTLVSGEVAIDGVVAAPELLAHRVAAGSVVKTVVGRVGVQFGDGSAFAVGAGSTVDVRRFDAAAVELAVDGELSVEVTRRAPGQRFTVLAGGRTVEVRGTAFRVVQRDGALEVACSHGRVAVIDRARAGGEIEVGAGQVARLAGDGLLGAARPLDAAALEALAAAQAPRLPVWADPAQLERTSGRLEVAVAPGHAVRVDGVAVGKGPITMRVTSGRYLVQAERAPGQWSEAEWLEVAAADGARLEVVAPRPRPGRAAVEQPTSEAALDERRAQLESLLQRGRVVTCLRALTKQGLTDTFVELDMGVDTDGAIAYLNIASTDLPRSTAACVRDAVAAIVFPAGAPATWRHRLTF
jgi:hypothetical protein